MSKVSDAGVEAAAEAMFNSGGNVIDWKTALKIAAEQPESAYVQAVQSYRHNARAALEAVSSIHEPEPEFSGSIPAHAKWCQPGDRQDKRMFIVRFDDQDQNDAVFEDEAEARAFYARATVSWNCWLFGTLDAHPAPISKGVTVKALIGDSGPHDNGPSDEENDDFSSVAVKALEWNPFEAHTPIGRYRVADHPGTDGLFSCNLDGNRVGRFASVAEAKAAAQADFDTRIRSCLSHNAGEIEAGGEDAIDRVEAASRLRQWVRKHFGPWITHSTAKRAIDEILPTALEPWQ